MESGVTDETIAARRMQPAAERTERSPRPLWPALLIGIGLAGTLDEVILHQLLHWHHFYDRAGLDAGLVSDGLFHLASTAALVIGVVGALIDNGRQIFSGGGRPERWIGHPRRFWGGVFVGLGGFNLYDATIQHKVLRLHQVRPAADDWVPYDLAFGGLAAAILAVGLVLLLGHRSAAR